MSDAAEALWVEVEGANGTENYFVDETFELEWSGVAYTYAVLVREEDFSAYAEGEEVIPDVLRFSEDKQTLEEIEDDDEKAYVIDTIDAFYRADAESSPS
jgi:hypothetical protein